MQPVHYLSEMMHDALKRAFEAELSEADKLWKAGKLESAIPRLENAHVLGQRFVVPHFRCHWMFLQIGWVRKAPGEILGQLVRLVLGTIGSAVGRVPTGNTGGTNIGMFRTLPIDPSLLRILAQNTPQDQRNSV